MNIRDMNIREANWVYRIVEVTRSGTTHQLPREWRQKRAAEAAMVQYKRSFQAEAEREGWSFILRGTADMDEGYIITDLGLSFTWSVYLMRCPRGAPRRCKDCQKCAIGEEEARAWLS